MPVASISTVHGLNSEGTLAKRDRFMARRIETLSKLSTRAGPCSCSWATCIWRQPHLPAELLEAGHQGARSISEQRDRLYQKA